jgi:hypothetical protein
MAISSRALSITGIDDRRYWNFIPNDESRYLHKIESSHGRFYLYAIYVCSCIIV